MPRVLHILSQRPFLTGSGITLEALVIHGRKHGWKQAVVVGVPSGDISPAIGGLDRPSIHPLWFGGDDLPFPVPGMSDVMPYPSTVFSSMSSEMLDSYRSAWRAYLRSVVDHFRPDLIHCHHVWIVSSLLKDVAPGIPVVTHCHATGLRQMELCPHLAPEVRRGCRRNDKFVVLHQEHAGLLSSTLGVEPDRIEVVGAGFREEIFHCRGEARDRESNLLYTGKYSHAKGLPWLLDAVANLAIRHRQLRLHVAGSGSGAEAEALAARMRSMSPVVEMHGMLSQAALGDLMRGCRVCVLPSFYEGVPLVLVEALACGCRLVATALPGVVRGLAPFIGDHMELVPLPRLMAVDTPDPSDLPAFTARLEAAIESSLDKDEQCDPAMLDPFRWSTVFRRIDSVWQGLL